MMMPSIFGENLFDDDWMNFPFEQDFWGKKNPLYGKHAKNLMKTDIREHDAGYEVDIDLPGFKKDEISIELENGYLTVSAAKGLDKDEEDKKGKYIRKERYAGAMQRRGNVFSRKVIHRSWSFTEELVVAVFVLITLLAAALACREGELVSLTLVTDRLPKKLKKPSVILITVLSIIFSVILFKYGMDKVITQLQNGKRTFVLNWPEWIFWSFVPIGAGCMILHFIEFCLDFCCKTDSAKNTDNSTKSNMNTITTDKKEAK